jgi:hypothetical protein
MFSFRRLALLLALCLASANLLLAQDSNQNSTSSSSTIVDPSEDASQQQGQAPPPAAGQQPAPDQGTVSVQARIKARREKRRADAIRDVYTHLYEAYLGMGYLRFAPGENLQHTTYYAWDTGFTRYYSERLGVTLDARGYYGTAFVGLNFSSVTRPSISTYTFMGGPTYRFLLYPKYSLAGRVMGGGALGNFSSDTNGFGSTALGMWPDGGTYALNPSLIGEYNLTPGVGLRLTGDYVMTGFGSTLQHSFGFTGGMVYRFGRQ